MMSQSMNRSIRGNPHAQTATIAQARQERDQVGRDWRPHGTTPGSLIEALTALTALSGRCLALKARNRELADEVKQLHAERRYLRSQTAAVSNLQPVQAPRPARARNFRAREDERRRLERDLHDGVQNELVALIVKLRLAEQDPDMPPALARTLAALGARAEATLDSVPDFARGVYPPLLAGFGVLAALRARARRHQSR
jgi:signal transduction histidine kinase